MKKFTHLDSYIQQVEEIGALALLGMLKTGADAHRLAAQLLHFAESGAVHISRHIMIQLERVLDAERALGLQAVLVHHRVVEAPLT